MTWTEIVQRFLGGTGSKTDAKNRLLLVLQEDRLGLTPEKKEALRRDILANSDCCVPPPEPKVFSHHCIYGSHLHLS